MCFAEEARITSDRFYRSHGRDKATPLECCDWGACRRPNGGGPGRGCPRRPAGTHPHLLMVGACNLIAVSCLARLGARRCEIRQLQPADPHLLGSLTTEGFINYYLYTIVKISRSTSPILLFEDGHSSILPCPRARLVFDGFFWRRGGYGPI
jgi:hypothetical protein